MAAEVGGTVYLGPTDRYGQINGFSSAQAFTNWFLANGRFEVYSPELEDS